MCPLYLSLCIYDQCKKMANIIHKNTEYSIVNTLLVFIVLCKPHTNKDLTIVLREHHTFTVGTLALTSRVKICKTYQLQRQIWHCWK